MYYEKGRWENRNDPHPKDHPKDATKSQARNERGQESSSLPFFPTLSETGKQRKVLAETTTHSADMSIFKSIFLRKIRSGEEANDVKSRTFTLISFHPQRRGNTNLCGR